MVSILTVDDSASMRQMIKFTLENAGFNVFEASDGEEAFEWAKTNSTPDLILADVNMPKMDGITLLRHLRSLKNYEQVPILMLTTDSSQDKKTQGKGGGATGWIVKPFNPEQLVDTIHKVIKKNKG